MADARLTPSGSVIATTFESGGETFPHHVIALFDPEAEPTDEPQFGCVEHTVTNCPLCGRTPGEQSADDECPHDAKRVKCGCDLPRVDL